MIHKNTNDEMIVLNARFKVTTRNYEYYRELTVTALQNLAPGKYLLKQIFGPDCWEVFGILERRLMGMCVARMVRHGELPLAPVIKKSKYPLQYFLE